MKKLWLILLGIIVLSVAACVREPVAQKQTENPNFSVAILFDFDGVRVYRFYDGGEYIYFAKSLDNVRTLWWQSEGKSSRYISVNTVEPSWGRFQLRK